MLCLLQQCGADGKLERTQVWSEIEKFGPGGLTEGHLGGQRTALSRLTHFRLLHSLYSSASDCRFVPRLSLVRVNNG